ncbi:hypothetical protein AVEN_15437-1 [Araneus ventricosus]|uniref:Uncharacterized protein n=1 Tax=Araneus ventricosus TaxID=182803 RepID=A0A4Y2CTS5_ARAVE|nr:hypothetical protein AVEN_15437-1 [Araneus ventricosus]
MSELSACPLEVPSGNYTACPPRAADHFDSADQRIEEAISKDLLASLFLFGKLRLLAGVCNTPLWTSYASWGVEIITDDDKFRSLRS